MEMKPKFLRLMRFANGASPEKKCIGILSAQNGEKMEQIPNSRQDISNLSCFLLGPDGTVRLETANSVEDAEKKSIIKFSFLADILGPEWAQHKKIWIHLTNRNIIVPRGGCEKNIAGILYKTE